MIYVHIPFCRQACHYCDFHFSTNLAGTQALVQAIVEEGRLRKTFLSKPPETLYLGGGTPSILSIDEISALVYGLGESFDLTHLQEFTLEANPDDVTPEKLSAWAALGINRISLGVQSFDDTVLAGLNRSHDTMQAEGAIALIQQSGFFRLSTDLIFGLPGQTMTSLERDLDMLLAFGLAHISIYGLTIEDRTVFGRRVARGQMAAPDDELAAAMMMRIMERLSAAGLQQYEISNFALPGQEAIHNSRYWEGVPYLGLGPSAHSYDGVSRSHNVRSNTAYLQGINACRLQAELELLTPQNRFNERILTGLRLLKGVDVAQAAMDAGVRLPYSVTEILDRWQRLGLAEVEGALVRLTPQGRLVADALTLELIVEG